MYRVSPLTYLVGGVVSTGLHARPVICSSTEIATLQPPTGSTCGQYLGSYAAQAGGSIYNPNALSDCQYCPLTNADQFLSSVAISWNERWRNYGLGFAYIIFNVAVAVLLYYLVRVRKSSGKSMQERFAPLLGLFRRDAKAQPKGDKKKEPTAPVPGAITK